MHAFLKNIYAEAKKKQVCIVLAEAEDPRVVKAAGKIQRLGIANLILIGKPEKVRAIARRQHVTIKSPIVDHMVYAAGFADKLYGLRKKKGMTRPQALKLVKDPRYFAALLVYSGEADAFVSGSVSPTAATLRPALQIIRTPRGERAHSYFIMLDPKRKEPYFFADCGMNIDPDAKLLAKIAVDTANVAKSFGVTPRVALLSYSTHGSAGGATAGKVRKALTYAKRLAPRLSIDGDLQFDAAFVPEIGKHKAPKSSVAGRANVFIFPELAAGNIGYKIAERVGGWTAIGPLMSGLKKPVNDLSRGCSVDDIVAVVAVSALQK